MFTEIIAGFFLVVGTLPFLLLLFVTIPYLYLLLIMIFSPKRVRRGSSRIVVLFGPYAYKFPTFTSWRGFLKGLLANMSEATFATVRSRHLAPARMVMPGGFVLYMDRVEPLREEEFDSAMEKWYNELLLLPPNDRVMIENLVEHKRDSFGWLDGQLVAIDYAKPW